MNKKIIAGIGTAALVFSIGSAQALAEPGGFSIKGFPAAMGQQFGEKAEGEHNEKQQGVRGEKPEGMPGAPGGFLREEFTDSDKAEMEAARAEREGKIQAFINSLNSEQKALYEGMTPVKPAEGQQPARPDETTLAAMREKQETFIASLSDSQKAAYDELFARHGGSHQMGMKNDETKADMEAMRVQYEEKMNAFTAALTESQKSDFEALKPAQPAEGQQPARPDEAVMAAMKEKHEAFITSLSESQKAAYNELFGGHGGGHPIRTPGDGKAEV